MLIAIFSACGGGDDDNNGDDLMFENLACQVTEQVATCTSATIESVGVDGDLREVFWNAPVGDAPAQGRPAVILFQGSLVGPSNTWDTAIALNAPFGGYYQVALVSRLIDEGFTVIQPAARGEVAWTTNSGGNYDTSADAAFIPLLLAQIEGGRFGAIDNTRLFATGISSGGYMTSRMAVSYAGRFRALAIAAGSYATCLGPICSVPSVLPADHPPTLFMHGTADTTVPISTARTYAERLMAAGIETNFIEAPGVGHAWLSAAPDAVATWFLTH